MVDFTSALYLGMRHGSGSLPAWRQFTAGKPAALEEPAGARETAGALALLLGCEAGTLAASSLHVAWDLFTQLAENHRIEILMDAATYPIARWGIERAAAHGVPVQTVPHHDADALALAVTRCRRRGRRPVVATDGFCPACGRLAPLRDYLACADEGDGWLVIDDTQALGILGRSPDAALPYGYCGGGSMRHCGLRNPRLLVIGSLAKGFGAPVAVLAGSREAIAAYERRSETRVHCSPPSLPVVHAARRALAVNRRWGDALRGCLWEQVRYFRRRLAQLGIEVRGGSFPVQMMTPRPAAWAVTLHEALWRHGIRSVLQTGRGRTGGGPCLSFLLTARHQRSDIDHTLEILSKIDRKLFTQPSYTEVNHETTNDVGSGTVRISGGVAAG